jgi:DNA-binding CsgD family transcriptional regulator/PAS domain-containing protein
MIHAGALYGVDEVFTAREAVGDEFWTGSQMYREWNRPFGLTEHLSGIIRKDIVRVGALTVLRQKPFDEVEKEKLKLLLPHLRRSVTIAQLISGKTVERDRFREIVDRLIVAVFLVDSTGLIHHANTAGQQLLTEGKVLRSRNGRLTSLISHEQAALLAAIEAGHKGAPAVALTMRDGTALIATILPLKDGYRLEASYRTKAAAAVFVDNPAGRFEYPGEMICKLFKLTGAELQLLLALLDGVTLQGAAERFGVSLATVKTHLQRIFAKTDTARQAELIRKVGQLMRPVRR